MVRYILRPFRIRVVIRRYEAILATSVLLLSGAVMPSSWDVPFHFYPAPHVEPPPKHPWIALTFDDGPHPGMTERLLDVLREQNAVGTFFIVGKMADRAPDLVRAIVRNGNELANHTYNHPNMCRVSDEMALSELAQTRAVIQRLTGRDCVFWRPPGGDYNRRIVRLTARAGYHMVLWNILTDDVEGASPDAIQKRILDSADDGSIILMHSGVEGTIQVLPEVIVKLRRRGYHFVTMSTLMGMPSSAPAPVQHDTPVLTTVSAGPSLKSQQTQ